MATEQAPAPATTDRDLASIHQARTLARAAKQAQARLAELSQAEIDAIIDAMAAAVTPQADALARLAHDETGYGVVADKIQKNLFASQRVYEHIRPMKTVGVIARHEDTSVVDIAEPFGVVAAIVPSTNPTSTAIYKILIAIKARCAVVLSPHPSAARSITRVAEIMADAARQAGAPDGSIGWMTTVTLEGTEALMKSRDVAVILATGGMGLVRAAYSAGKPAYGVGPGNAPCYVEQTADVKKAANDIVIGKVFDGGVLCSSPNSVVVDEPVAEELRRELKANGAYFLSEAEATALARVLVTPQRLPNPKLVGKPAPFIAEACGFAVPADTRVLVAELNGVGRDYPLSIEKLCPVLSFYVVSDWREGCERCKAILGYGGMGHTMSIHSRNEAVILEFGLKKPAFRICVNTPTTHGSIGLTTGLEPALTLGCGGYGGNITSDNISPRHLLNLKRLAYEVRPAPRLAALAPADSAARAPVGAPTRASATRLPQAPTKPLITGIPADTLGARIDQFLDARGFSQKGVTQAAARAATGSALPALGSPGAKGEPPTPVNLPVPFVCEDDVRQAIKAHAKIVVGERTIVTPAARDLGEAHQVFVYTGGPV